MQLSELKDKNIIRTGEFKEESFGIGNLAIILEILRNRMYSNPIKAIAQEVMSNARDAHREIGKPNLPIEVQIPTNVDPIFYIKDFGLGIDPERMSDVFLKYGCSTKRDNDNQTGGFGLGAKTPFAYTDSFSIITTTSQHIFEEKKGEETIIHEDCHVKRQYVAYIDESTIGKMALVNETYTKEPCGTQICITVDKEDFKKFEDWVRYSAQYWEVKPIVKGTHNWEWRLPKVLFSGDNWFIEEYSGQGVVKAIIDGIPYPIDINRLGYNDYYGNSDKDDRKIYKLLHKPLVLKFNTGDLRMSADREKIEYDKGNKQVDFIRNRLSGVIGELVKEVEKRISTSQNLWEAKCNLKNVIAEWYEILDSQKYKWNGMDVDDSGISMRPYEATLYKASLKDNYLKVKEVSAIEAGFGNVIYIHDEKAKKPNRKRLQTLVDMEDVDNAYVICFHEDSEKIKESKDKLEKDHNFSKLGVKNLSTIEESEVRKRYRTRKASSNNTIKGKKGVYDVKRFAGGHETISHSWESIRIDVNVDSGIYVELSRYDAFLSENETVSNYSLDNLKDYLSIDNIYGIPSRFIKKFENNKNWTSLKDVALLTLESLKKDKDIIEYCDNLYNTDQRFAFDKVYYSELKRLLSEEEFTDILTDEFSYVLDYIDISNSYSSTISSVKKVKDLCRILRIEFDKQFPFNKANNKCIFKDYNEKIKKDFPWFRAFSVNTYFSCFTTDWKKPILCYIKAQIEEKRQLEEKSKI